MNGIWQDVRQATRSLMKSPMITAIAVLTLALGIGANTAIYTVLDATLLSPPPYEEPDELVAVWGILPARDIDTWPAAPREIDDLQRSSELFEDFAGILPCSLFRLSFLNILGSNQMISERLPCLSSYTSDSTTPPGIRTGALCRA